MQRFQTLCLLLFALAVAAAQAGPPPDPKKAVDPAVVVEATPPVVEEPVAGETPSPLTNYYPSNSDVVGLSKRIYASVGSKAPVDLAKDFKGEYETLNVDGTLGPKLDALYEMRLDDLQRSVRHAKKMRDLLDVLEAPEGA